MSSPIAIPQLAAGYVRGSTEEQQDTLVVQAEQIARYCEYRKLELSHPIDGSACFVDSGTSASQQPFYERVCAAGMISWMLGAGVRHLILTKLDRGFRNTLDCLFTLPDLEQKGITVHILNLQLDTSTPTGKFVLTVMAAQAELENAQRSERQRDVFSLRRAKNKICGTIPYGWQRRSEDDEQLVPNRYEQATLHRLLRGDLSALTVNEAARRLNTAGVPAKHGGEWYPATIRKLRDKGQLAQFEQDDSTPSMFPLG